MGRRAQRLPVAAAAAGLSPRPRSQQDRERSLGRHEGPSRSLGPDARTAVCVSSPATRQWCRPATSPRRSKATASGQSPPSTAAGLPHPGRRSVRRRRRQRRDVRASGHGGGRLERLQPGGQRRPAGPPAGRRHQGPRPDVRGVDRGRLRAGAGAAELGRLPLAGSGGMGLGRRPADRRRLRRRGDQRGEVGHRLRPLGKRDRRGRTPGGLSAGARHPLRGLVYLALYRLRLPLREPRLDDAAVSHRRRPGQVPHVAGGELSQPDLPPRRQPRSGRLRGGLQLHRLHPRRTVDQPRSPPGADQAGRRGLADRQPDAAHPPRRGRNQENGRGRTANRLAGHHRRRRHGVGKVRPGIVLPVRRRPLEEPARPLAADLRQGRPRRLEPPPIAGDRPADRRPASRRDPPGRLVGRPAAGAGGRAGGEAVVARGAGRGPLDRGRRGAAAPRPRRADAPGGLPQRDGPVLLPSRATPVPRAARQSALSARPASMAARKSGSAPGPSFHPPATR